MDVLAVHIGTISGQHLTCRGKAPWDTYYLSIFQRARQESIRRGTLSHGDFDASTVDFIRSLQRESRTGHVTVIDFHEHVAEGEIFTSRRVARGNTDVPLVLAEAFVVFRWIVVGHQSNAHREPCAECARQFDRYTAELAVTPACYQNGI